MSDLDFLNRGNRHPALVARMHEAMASNAVVIAGLHDDAIECEFEALRAVFQADVGADDMQAIAQNWTLDLLQFEIERRGLFHLVPVGRIGGSR